MSLRILLSALFCLMATAPVVAQNNNTQKKEASPEAKVPQGNGEKLSDAERITRLQQAIDENKKLIQDLKSTIDDPESEYARAEQEFKKLDEQLKAKQKELRESGSSEKGEIQDIEKQWKLAKDRFDLAIQERRTLQEQQKTLQQRIEQDEAALKKLVAPPEPQKTEGAASTTAPAPGSDQPATQPAQAASEKPTEAQPESEKPQVPVIPGMPSPTPASQEGQASKPQKEKPVDKELVQAKEEAAAKETEAKQAEEELHSLEERITTLKKTIDSEKQLLKNARKKSENARETDQTLSEQIDKLTDEGAPTEKVQETRTKMREARQRLNDAQGEVRKRVDNIDKLQDELADLQSQRIAALEQADQKRREAEQAKQQVEEFQNPFSPRNLLKWTVEHGPRVLAIIIGMFVILSLVRLADKRLVKLIAGRTDRGSREERENRATTLVAVFHNAAHVIVIIGGLLMILSEFNIDITPLLGGAAVMGLAVAFGAQNLIRDFFTGFIILLENQYGVNDVVRIGENAGLVERITLRVTVLRDLEGTVHFIPNGEVKTVRNMTHGWSRALFDIGVAYKEQVDHVMKVLMDLARELRQDPDFKYKILADPEMLGVDAFADSAVVIKFMIKTRPLQQWAVKRELNRRIKNKFDELGIEIPFPHRTVYHRTDDGNSILEGLTQEQGRTTAQRS